MCNPREFMSDATVMNAFILLLFKNHAMLPGEVADVLDEFETGCLQFLDRLLLAHFMDLLDGYQWVFRSELYSTSSLPPGLRAERMDWAIS